MSGAVLYVWQSLREHLTAREMEVVRKQHQAMFLLNEKVTTMKQTHFMSREEKDVPETADEVDPVVRYFIEVSGNIFISPQNVNFGAE